MRKGVELPKVQKSVAVDIEVRDDGKVAVHLEQSVNLLQRFVERGHFPRRIDDGVPERRFAVGIHQRNDLMDMRSCS